MYHILQPPEKLLYLAFWQESSIGNAAALCGMSEKEAGEIAEKLMQKKIVRKSGKGFQADLGYLVEMVERDNHFYPHRHLDDSDRRKFVRMLGSDVAAILAYSRFDFAVNLAKENKEVLSGFFSELFSGYFAIASAYHEVFGGKDTPGNRSKCKMALLAQNKKRRIFPDSMLRGALSRGFVFSIPAGIVEFLGWSVNQLPERFVVKEIFLKERAKA